MEFTTKELAILDIVSEWRNYDNLESEINDNAVGVYLRDILEFTPMSANEARGVLSSLIQKNMLYLDRVNGENFFRATDECLEYLYNVLDKESLV